MYEADKNSDDEAGSSPDDNHANSKGSSKKAKSQSQKEQADDDVDDEDTPVQSKDDELRARMEKLDRMARGEDSSGSDSSDSDDSDADSEADDVEEEEEEQEDIPMGQVAKRVAVMNCDWDWVKAVDLLVLFQVSTVGTALKAKSLTLGQSFVPASAGFIKSIAVYPSQFGLEKMVQSHSHHEN